MTNLASSPSNHVDVLIVGAGISGIGAACHLQREAPGRTFMILEGRPDIGGTWILFRYPGVRSDSDMHTLGFRFKPWKHEKSIADGPSIMEYLRETVAEYGITDKIRFGQRVERAPLGAAREGGLRHLRPAQERLERSDVEVLARMGRRHQCELGRRAAPCARVRPLPRLGAYVRAR